MERRFDRILETKKIIDLSQPIYNDCPCSPNNPDLKVNLLLNYHRDKANLELLKITTHTGTHMDAPYHLIQTGKTIDDFNVNKFIGWAIPVNLFYKKPNEPIIKNDLIKYDKYINKNDIVLLCTGWGKKRGKKMWIHQSPWLDVESAKWLVKKKIKGMGIDHFTICTTKKDIDRKVHLVLLKAGIWIIEDMYLPKTLLSKKKWFFIGLPINISKSSGSWVRPIVIKMNKI